MRIDRSQAEPLAIVGARLIDGTGAPRSDSITVLIEEGRVKSVGTDPPPVGAEIIDVEGRTVLPGLIDAHVHLSSLPHVKEELQAFGLVQAASALLASGITTVRDLGSYGHSLFRLRDAVAGGLCAGPRLVLCGHVISATCPGAKAFPGMYREANGPDDFRRAVREEVSVGADVIKVMTTGALTVSFEEVEPAQLTRSELEALVDEAHRLGFPVASHAEGADGVTLSVEAGVDTVEHGEQGHLVPGALSTMAERGIVLVPTLSVFDHVAESDEFPPWMRERGRRLGESARLTVGAARREGVPIAMGADAPPHGGNARELVLLAEAGLSPVEAVAAATSVAARACRIESDVGTVQPGKVADLLVVDGDPIADPAVLANPDRLWAVFQDGRVVARWGRTTVN